MATRIHGKTALVLAGGGLTGAVYEIGALRAIDDMLVDRTVNDFDIYVGTSAGALVSSFLANGLSPEAMFRVLEGSNPQVKPVQRRHIFGINYLDALGWGLQLPKKLTSAWAQYLRHINEMTMLDLLLSLTEALPAGLYDSLSLERYVRETLQSLGDSNDFTQLQRELYIIATDLDTGERAVFGRGNQPEVPISLAVAASSALPMIYKPVRIGQHEYVDGGLRGNASLDLAIEHGANLIICINPMVPFDHSDRPEFSTRDAHHLYLSDKGIQAIANQALRITSHASLHYHIKQLRRAHPEVDIIFIEPKPEDYQMFFYNIMRYSAQLTVARHGFESATLDLAEDYPIYKQILARHSIPITRRLVIGEIAKIQQSGYDPEVIRHVLEARSGGCGQHRRGGPVCQLTRVLSELEMALDDLGA